jgi:hypothetical protein
MRREDRPAKCAHCGHGIRPDGGWLEIQYSSRAQAWLCLSCHLRARRGR